MEIVVKRMIPGKKIRHRLKVDYDSKKKRVPYDQDYTIYPNDIVLRSFVNCSLQPFKNFKEMFRLL